MPNRSTITLLAACLVAAPAVIGCATTRSTGAQMDDAGVTRRVSNQLTMDSGVAKWRIDVDTLEGVVTLRGQVPSETEKQRAEEIASGVSGVKSVRNELLVETDRDVADGNPDALLTTAVKAKLAGSPDTEAVDVDVDTQDRVVTLSGVVQDERARQRAVELAGEVKGVEQVVDELKVADAR
jgi:hyperosmotically inducible periplasmic protein